MARSVTSGPIDDGFMFSEADEITTICNACDPKAELANSIVWFLRECQHIFQNE